MQSTLQFKFVHSKKRRILRPINRVLEDDTSREKIFAGSKNSIRVQFKQHETPERFSSQRGPQAFQTDKMTWLRRAHAGYFVKCVSTLGWTNPDEGNERCVTLKMNDIFTVTSFALFRRQTKFTNHLQNKRHGCKLTIKTWIFRCRWKVNKATYQRKSPLRWLDWIGWLRGPDIWPQHSDGRHHDLVLFDVSGHSSNLLIMIEKGYPIDDSARGGLEKGLKMS